MMAGVKAQIRRGRQCSVKGNVRVIAYSFFPPWEISSLKDKRALKARYCLVKKKIN
jgi:hypothetical protein